MNLRRQRRDEPTVNLTPLIDVVFLLLIFFMVSTTFNDDARLRLQLPEADGEPVAADELERVEVVIDAHGRYYVDDQRVVDNRPETLQKALVGTVGPRRDLPLLIKADAATPHQAVMTALDAARHLGMTRVVFAASRGGSAQ
ncbi:MAG: biopolymer transporter ExbD [Thiohalocapsa sp.]|jgi:biopolymer transport protein ExbD